MRDSTKILLLAALGGLGAWLWFSDAGRRAASGTAMLIETGIDKLMDLTDSTLQLIKRFEGFSAYRYKDADGYSIGYGHFIRPGESFPEPLPEPEAYALLKQDATAAANAVRSAVKVPLSQDQFDALTSLAYNIGAGAFANSTLVKKLNAGDYTGAATEFPRWNKSGGQVLAALVERRSKEKAIFDRGTA